MDFDYRRHYQRNAKKYRATIRLYGLALTLVGGLVTIAAALAVITRFNPFDPDGIEQFVRGFEDPTLPFVIDALGRVLALFGILIGLKTVLSGLKNAAFFIVPRNFPPKFANDGQPYAALRGTQPLGRSAKPIRIFGLFAVMGDRVTIMTPAEDSVARKLATSTGRGFVLGVLALFFGVLCLVGPRVVQSADPPVAEPEVIEGFSASLLAVLTLLGAIAVSTGASLVGLLLSFPSRPPAERAIKSVIEVQADRHPETIFALLEDTANEIEEPGTPARTQAWPAVLDQTRQSYSRSLLIEGQPRFSTGRLARPAWFGMAASLLLAPIGVWILGSVGRGNQTPMEALLTFIAAVVFLTAARRMLRLGMEQLRIARFEAPIIAIEFQGAMEQSRLTVGSSKRDSVRSETGVTRSNVLIRFFAAHGTSETAAQNGQASRLLVEMDHDDRVTQGLARVQAKLNERLTVGVEALGVANESGSAEKVMNLNAAMRNPNAAPQMFDAAAASPALPTGASADASPDAAAGRHSAQAKAQAPTQTPTPAPPPAQPSSPEDAANGASLRSVIQAQATAQIRFERATHLSPEQRDELEVELRSATGFMDRGLLDDAAQAFAEIAKRCDPPTDAGAPGGSTPPAPPTP